MPSDKPYQRLDHGVSADRPISCTAPLWTCIGPGLRDMHFEVELGLVRQGEMRRTFAGGEENYGPGMIWIHGIWEPHSAYVTQVPLNLVVLHIHPLWLSTLAFAEAPNLNWMAAFRASVSDRPPRNLLPRKHLLTFAEALAPLAKASSWSDRLRLRMLTLDLLLSIIEAWDNPRAHRRHVPTGVDRLAAALELIISSPRLVRVEEVANRCGMSRNGFNKFFQAQMGIRFSIFALHHRLSQAAAELLETDYPIKAIALTWGFADTSHFYRRFAEVYGCTPSDYRIRRQVNRNEG